MLKISICDDDVSALNATMEKIRKFARQQQLFWREIQYSSSETLMTALKNGEYSNIYILDVEMPVYSGLDLAREIRRKNPEGKVIISSVYKDYGVDAVNADIARYVLKGDSEEQFFSALQDVVQMLEKEPGEILQFQRYSDVISIDSSDVLYITKESKYCIFHMCNGSKMRIRSSIQQVFSELPGNKFLFTDKGVVASVQKITGIENNVILLQGGTRIPVSRNRKREVMEHITAYFASSG